MIVLEAVQVKKNKILKEYLLVLREDVPSVVELVVVPFVVVLSVVDLLVVLLEVAPLAVVLLEVAPLAVVLLEVVQ